MLFRYKNISNFIVYCLLPNIVMNVNGIRKIAFLQFAVLYLCLSVSALNVQWNNITIRLMNPALHKTPYVIVLLK